MIVVRAAGRIAGGFLSNKATRTAWHRLVAPQGDEDLTHIA